MGMDLKILNELYGSFLIILPKILVTIIILVIIITAYNIMAGILKKVLLKHIKDKKSKNNVFIFIKVIKYVFYILLFLGIIFFSTGSLAGFGISAGLLSAALGWALQRPITGMAAWIMLITKKPFSIGDRIMIGDLKGDVEDINLTHVHLNEVGGTVASEERSGRITMIPNSILFEQKIINYTMQDEYILDEVTTLITYESNLDEAISIVEKEAKKVTQEISHHTKPPFVRTIFAESGIKVIVRYYTDTASRVKRMSDITQGIFRKISAAKDIEIAYPHTVIRIEESRPSKHKQ